MLYWQSNSRDRLKKAILQRHQEYINACDIQIKENKKYASLWNMVHMTIGLAAVFSSSVSTILTFYLVLKEFYARLFNIYMKLPKLLQN